MFHLNRPGKLPGFDEMVGSSRAMKRLYKQIDRVSGINVPVLIVGESGTGKELVARSVHGRSDRSDRPFVPVNTGAIPPELIASELFGHEKGSFTGAEERKAGYFERAAGGTLFLDEITTMDERTQVSLLRVLENKSFRRVGGNELFETDVRIIAASNRDLREAIRDGRFREDLYHRLDVFKIVVPPLRKRKDDIPLLVESFIARYRDEFEHPVKSLSPKTFARLKKYDWPGNVRELENLVTRTLIMSRDETIGPDQLPEDFQRPGTAAGRISMEMGLTLEEAELEYILRTVEHFGGNKTAAAESLGISRKTLYNKLERLTGDPLE